MRGIYGNFSRDFTLEEQGPGAQVRQQCPAEARQRPGLSVAKSSQADIAISPLATPVSVLPEHPLPQEPTRVCLNIVIINI